MLQIATAKVEQIIALARQFDVQVAPWDDASSADRENDMASSLELTEDELLRLNLRVLLIASTRTNGFPL
jgi:hypothetical protein